MPFFNKLNWVAFLNLGMVKKSTMEQILTLSDKKPIFEGLTRSVFINDKNPDYLIKIPSQAWQKKLSCFSSWRRFRKSVDINSPNMRELKEYMHHFNTPELATAEKHLLQIVGLIATDIGWGLVVKAERDQFGNYAKPFGQYKNEIPLYKNEISEFIAWVKSTKIVCYDLKFDNIVLSWRNNKPTLVLIDGIGENGIFALRHWFLKYNTAKNKHELQEFTDALQPFIELSSLNIHDNK